MYKRSNQLEVHRTLKHWSLNPASWLDDEWPPCLTDGKVFLLEYFKVYGNFFFSFGNILLFKANTLLWMCSCQWPIIGRAEYQCRTWVNNSSVRGLNTNKFKTFSSFYFPIFYNFTHPIKLKLKSVSSAACSMVLKV